MGVLPLQFVPGENAASLGLTGYETFDILGLDAALTPREQIKVRVHRENGEETTFTTIARVDSPIDIDYLQHGGVLPFVLRGLLRLSRSVERVARRSA